MGAIIHYFEIQPFIVTLAGMFLARGLCYAITRRRDLDHDPRTSRSRAALAAAARRALPDDGAIVALVVVAVGIVRAAPHAARPHRLRRRRQRAVGAADGPRRSAARRSRVYTISGFCSALGGILLSFYMLSGSGSLAVGMELDAIAAVVIGGTLLTGGVGLPDRLGARRARARPDQDADRLPGHAQLVVDEDRDRAAAARVHPAAAARVRPPAGRPRPVTPIAPGGRLGGGESADLRSRRDARRHRLRARLRVAARARRGGHADRRVADPPPDRDERRAVRAGGRARGRDGSSRRRDRGDPAPPRRDLPRAAARAAAAAGRAGAAGRPPRAAASCTGSRRRAAGRRSTCRSRCSAWARRRW